VGGKSDARPTATLATSPRSAAAFEGIRDAWADPEHTSPAALRAKIDSFIARFPKDGLAPLARIALAFAALREGDLHAADAALAQTADVPAGTTRELWTVARARRLRLGNDAEAALVLLRPLVGKSVDPLARALFEEELTLTAVATERDYEAISYMDTWLRASTPDEKPATLARVAAIVQDLPRDVLVGALQAMSSQRATLGYGADIERVLAQRLVTIATTSGDAELARTLIAADPQAFNVAGDAGAALGDLVTSRRGLNVVQGRTLGLLLPTDSPGLRDESADVLRGVLWALGLPRGSRTLPADARTAATTPATPAAPPTPASRVGAAPSACAPLEPAPDTPEPRDEDDVHLVTRDDAGSSDRTEVSLDELAGEGAAMVIAGLDPETAVRALHWGEAHGVPVMALVPPAETMPSFGFLLGESRSTVLATLAHAEPSLLAETATPIADASELALYPPQGERLAGLTLGPPVSCDIPSTQAGEPRFPLSLWQEEKTRAWVVSGSPECSQDLVEELVGARSRGAVALTLEAAAVVRATPALRVVSARAGIVPDVDPSDPREAEVLRFSASLGHAGWWTALGRDAATLARTALLALPVGSVSEPRPVAERRSAARDALAKARARLWTTESSSWEGDRTLKRTVCAVESPQR
jgi:hypothetical protein